MSNNNSMERFANENLCSYCGAKLTNSEKEFHPHICSKCWHEISDILESQKEN